MKVMKIQEYNHRQHRKYAEAVAKWQEDEGNDFIPQVAFFFFWTRNGKLRESGWVAVDKRRAIWAKTKKGVIERYDNMVMDVITSSPENNY